MDFGPQNQILWPAKIGRPFGRNRPRLNVVLFHILFDLHGVVDSQFDQGFGHFLQKDGTRPGIQGHNGTERSLFVVVVAMILATKGRIDQVCDEGSQGGVENGKEQGSIVNRLDQLVMCLQQLFLVKGIRYGHVGQGNEHVEHGPEGQKCIHTRVIVGKYGSVEARGPSVDGQHDG